jgi:hypothetical protein
MTAEEAFRFFKEADAALSSSAMASGQPPDRSPERPNPKSLAKPCDTSSASPTKKSLAAARFIVGSGVPHFGRSGERVASLTVEAACALDRIRAVYRKSQK